MIGDAKNPLGPNRLDKPLVDLGPGFVLYIVGAIGVIAALSPSSVRRRLFKRRGRR